jgi:sarcosine oxidase
MADYDAIVLGAGGVGSAAMYHLTRRGVRVLGIDAHQPPHDYGSTHGHTRVIRQAYFEHPSYVPLLRESCREWEALESISRRKLFHQIGLIEVGSETGVVVPGVLRAARDHGLDVTPMSGDEIEHRWPALRVGNGLVGVYEPAAGYLLVEDCVEAHLAAAKAAGAKLLIDRVTPDATGNPWRDDGDLVTVNLSDGDVVTARKLIITAGAWAGELLADLGLSLTVLRKSLFWFKSLTGDCDAAAGMPVYLFEVSNGIFYGFPKIDELGVKVAEHSGGQPVNPNEVDRTLDEAERQRVEHFLATHIPSVSTEIVHYATCLYTMSADEHFILDRHPHDDNVVFAAGLSGHGFKFTPVLGRALADLALDGGSDLPLDFLSLKRLQPA